MVKAIAAAAATVLARGMVLKVAMLAGKPVGMIEMRPG